MARKVTITTRTWTNRDGKESKAYRVSYADPAGGYDINKQFKRRSQAEEYRREVEAELTKGTHVPLSRSPTVTEFANSWLETGRLEGLERGTMVGREIKLRLHILPYLGDLKLAELTPSMVHDWLKRIADEPVPDELRKKDVRAGIRGLRSRYTIGQSLKCLRQMLEEAIALELVGRNATKAIRVKTASARAKIKVEAGVNFPTKEEVNAILAHAKGRYHPLIATLIYTGVRASELRGLLWDEHIDFAKEVIRVRQRVDAYRKVGFPKTPGSNREIPLVSQLANILQAWKKVCPRQGGIATRFPTSAANALSIARLLRANTINGVCKLSNLQVARALHVGPHSVEVIRKEMGLPPFPRGNHNWSGRQLESIVWPLEVAADEQLLSPGPEGPGRLHFVFPERGGKDLAHNTIYIELDRIQVELGMINPERKAQYRGKYSPHDFRHFYVSLLAEMGFSKDEVAEYVGHSSTTMTARYTHLFPKPAERRARLEDTFQRLRLVQAEAEKPAALRLVHDAEKSRS